MPDHTCFDQRSTMIEEWANYLATVHWDNLDELAAIIVNEVIEEGVSHA